MIITPLLLARTVGCQHFVEQEVCYFADLRLRFWGPVQRLWMGPVVSVEYISTTHKIVKPD
jgi:hypothetical protein